MLGHLLEDAPHSFHEHSDPASFSHWRHISSSHMYIYIEQGEELQPGPYRRVDIGGRTERTENARLAKKRKDRKSVV